jgi:hypothetical protein
MPVFRWEDIDHSLVSLRMTDLAEEMHVQIESDERRIRFENRNNMNSMAVPSLVLKMKQGRADDWALKVYDVYCDVWQKQGRQKSAAFVRAVFLQGVLPTLRARTGSIAAQFSRFAVATNFSSTARNAMLQGLQLNMQRLEDRWRRRIEIEAKECEHAQLQEVGESSKTSSPPEPSAISSAHERFDSKKQPGEPRNMTQRGAVIAKVKNPQTYSVLSNPEAALYFEVHARTLHRWLGEGKLRRGGRRGSVTIESILQWEKKRSRKRTSN